MRIADDEDSGIDLGGGFTPDTELITREGPRRIDSLSPDTDVYALSPTSGLAKFKPITSIRPLTAPNKVIAIASKRADFRVAPDQPIFYRTKAIDYPRLLRAGELGTREYYKWINHWHRPPGERLEAVDVTDMTHRYEACASTEVHGNTFRAALPKNCVPRRRNSHNGYYFDHRTFKQHQLEIESAADEVKIHAQRGAWNRPYRFDGDDFIEFIGWFITEGSVYRKRERRSAVVSIAQKTPRHRRTIAALFDRMGISVSVTKDQYRFGSTVYGELLERLCGRGSANKQLPWFTWQLCRAQKRRLIEVLLDGDGNARGTFYTASDKLAGGLLRLVADVGLKPRYTTRRNVWQIFINEVNDGFRFGKHVSTESSSDQLVRVGIEDFPAILAGRNGKFQWIGVHKVV